MVHPPILFIHLYSSAIYIYFSSFFENSELSFHISRILITEGELEMKFKAQQEIFYIKLRQISFTG